MITLDGNTGGDTEIAQLVVNLIIQNDNEVEHIGVWRNVPGIDYYAYSQFVPENECLSFGSMNENQIKKWLKRKEKKQYNGIKISELIKMNYLII